MPAKFQKLCGLIDNGFSRYFFSLFTVNQTNNHVAAFSNVLLSPICIAIITMYISLSIGITPVLFCILPIPARQMPPHINWESEKC